MNTRNIVETNIFLIFLTVTMSSYAISSVEANSLNIKKSVVGAFADEVKAVYPGEEITYRIHFDNNDNDFRATGITIVDYLPEQLSFVSADYDQVLGHYDADTHTYMWRYPAMQPGDATNVNITAKVKPDVLPGTTITNVAMIDSEQTSEATSSVDIITSSIIPIGLSKSVVGNYDKVYVGEEVTYSIRFCVNISQPVINVSVVDSLPQDLSFVKADGDGIIGYYDEITHTYTWVYSCILPGELVELEITAKVNQDVALGKTITNLATISSDQTLPRTASVDIITDMGDMEVEGLQIIPETIRRNDAITEITAVLIFPEGISREDIGEDPLVLFPGDIEASEQIIEEIDGKVKITAVFDEDAFCDAIASYGQVAVEIVGKFTSGSSFLGQTTITIIQAEDISDYISYIFIKQVWDHGDPTDSNDSMYEFNLEIYAYGDMAINMDADVASIEFLTPAGNNFHIPKELSQWSDNIWTSYEYNEEEHWPDFWFRDTRWEYRARFSDVADLQAYGDGEYTITLHYKSGNQSQTTAWFGMPGTEESIPQPTQEPIIIFPLPNQVVESPVAFSWESCTDVNASDIWIELEGKSNGGYKEDGFDLDKTSWGPVYLANGRWEITLDFENWSNIFSNNDGIGVIPAKYSRSRYEFTVATPPTNNYEVWGGETFIYDDHTTIDEDFLLRGYWSLDELQANGYVKLGESDGQTATFSGQYEYYIIATRGQILLDSIQGSDDSYYSSFEISCSTGNITDPNNILGPTDGLCAIVGKATCSSHFCGYFAFTNPGNWEGLTVITRNLNISKSIANPVEENENIGPDDTIIYSICFDSNDLIDAVTDVTIVDFLPDEVTFVSADSNEVLGEYDPNTHTCTWLYPVLAQESTIEKQLVVQVNPDVALGANITNFVTIDSNETPPTSSSVNIIYNRLAGELQMVPDTIRRNGTLTGIMGVLTLPEGIEENVDANELLVLSPIDKTEIKIRANNDQIVTETDGKIVIAAVFDMAQLMEAIPGYGPVGLIVEGKFTSGYIFYGEATIIITRFAGN